MNKYTIKPGAVFEPTIGRTDFFNWLQLSGIDAAKLDGTQDILITLDTIPTLTAMTTDGHVGTWPLNQPWSTVTTWLAAELGPKIAELDEIAVKVEQLRDARAKAAEFKAQAEELRAEVLGMLSLKDAQIGTVGGTPVVQIKTIPKTKFARAAFEAAYPGLTDNYISSYDETRLEFVK